jgi:hypothetical protein
MMGAEAATEAEWRALRTSRPSPLEGAARLAVGDIELLGTLEWPSGGVSTSLGLAELVVTGLLRRRDVDFVERRRFERASAVERSGSRPPGHPPAGVSPSAEFIVHAVWVGRSASESAIDVRLVRLATGEVGGATRTILPRSVDAVTLARGVVAGALEVLSDLDRRPEWEDPMASANDRPSAGVSPEALGRFVRGLAAEELFRWEEARRGYQAAAEDSSFYEATSALARTARLRLGGTIAES